MTCFLIFISLSVQLVAAYKVVNISVIEPQSNSDLNGCPPAEEIQAARDSLRANVYDILLQHVIPMCGDGLWHRVAFLNMSDPTQQCPSAWREYSSSGIRTCIRDQSDVGGCPGTVYNTNRQYSRICGRVIGYQIGSPDAFASSQGMTIDQAYMDGISITRGVPRKHVWSYVAGMNEQGLCPSATCPINYSYLLRDGSSAQPPAFIGNNYYCESAYPGTIDHCYLVNTFFPNDQLWDGQQCNNEGTCCTGDGVNTPPWFSVALSNPISDDIEVRICHNSDTFDEDTPIHLLELYVQ